MAERSGYLDSVRAAAIILVIAGHSLGYSLPLTEGQTELISFIVYTIAVPIFFLVDGYLLVRRNGRDRRFNYPVHIEGSFYRLIVPWFLFTAAYAIARYGMESAGVLEEKVLVGRSLSEVAYALYASVVASQLYFLPALFIVRLAAPAMLRLARAGGPVVVLLAIGYASAYNFHLSDFLRPLLVSEDGLDPVLHAFWGFQFYLAGVAIFLIEKRLLRRPFALSISACAVVALMYTWDLRPLDGMAIQYLYILGIYSLFFGLGEKAYFLETIGRHTMGIFLLHVPVVMKIVSVGVNSVAPTPIISWLLIAVTTFALSYITARTLDQTAIGSILFQGRTRLKAVSAQLAH